MTTPSLGFRRLSTAAAAFALATALGTWAAPSRADDSGAGGLRPPVPKDGREVYVFYCQGCHMADGKGATGAATYPSLASNPRLAVSAYPITVVQKGKGGMLWFRGMLTPAQVAQVVTYLRTHFGNDYKDPVTAADVERIAK
jgi:mono/diheme cytochrome c family protein